jgi:hypothetical protein
MDDQLPAVVAVLVALISAVFGSVVRGAVDARIKTDEGLRTQRLEAYPPLWRLTGTLSQWPRTHPTWSDVGKIHTELRNWYYNVGGMFLSERSRDLYLDVQRLAAQLLEYRSEAMDAKVSDAEYESLRETCSLLRTYLALDLETRRARSVWNAWHRSREFADKRDENRKRLEQAKIEAAARAH